MKLTVVCNLTLDGVMQAPAARDEDPRGGFKHGGWGAGYEDPVMAAEMGRSMGSSGSLLLGRRTYLHFYKVWPKRKNNPFTDVLNNTQKYVASRTLKEPLPWMNSTLLEGDAVAAVRKLKKQRGKEIVVLGSGDLVASLMPHGLIRHLPAVDLSDRRRLGAPPLSQGRIREAQARAQRADDQRRRDRDVPAGLAPLIRLRPDGSGGSASAAAGMRPQGAPSGTA